MKILGLLRHAKSDWDDMALRDFDRGLNGRGRKGAALMGAHIRDHGITFDLVMASPAERVRRTLEASGIAAPVEWRQDAYLADADTLMDIVRSAPDGTGPLLIAGHNPGLQDLLIWLVAPERRDALFNEAAEKFPTAAFAVIELDIDRWSQCRPGSGRLAHFARPRDLDPQLGPAGVG